jgi:hypothetical protein
MAGLRKEGLVSIGSMVLAFLASQHHTLHMLILGLGAGSAGMSFMTMYPTIRRLMLVLSLIMVVITVNQIRGKDRPRSVRLMGAVSAVLTLGLVGWSVWQFGL